MARGKAFILPTLKVTGSKFVKGKLRKICLINSPQVQTSWIWACARSD